MAGKKYTRDYQLTDTLDERGRIRTETSYVGAFFRFASGADTAKKAIKRMLVFSCLGSFCFLVSLLPRSTASLVLYVMLPYLFTALPLALQITVLIRLRSFGERLDHRAADQANHLVPGCCLWLLILPAVSLLGEAVALTIGRSVFLAGDAIFLAGALGVILCGWICFRGRNALSAAAERD